MKERLKALRAAMDLRGISAYILTGSDPHLSETVSARWSSLEWISQFTGSAGLIVVTMDKAALWTDFRYWIQAERELDSSLFSLQCQGKKDTINLENWLDNELSEGDVVALDAWTLSLEQGSLWASTLGKFGISLEDSGDLLDEIWEERPLASIEKVVDHPLCYSGVERETKIENLRKSLKNTGAEISILTSLDDIAWLFNLRGQDIPHNPVFRSFASISENETILYIEDKRLDQSILSSLINAGITVKKYDTFKIDLRKKNGSILMNPQRTAWAVIHYINPDNKMIFQPDIISPLKAVKNTVEIKGFKNAMIRDGIALTRFQMELKSSLEKGENIEEIDVSKMINLYRGEQKHFKGNSFSPISAFGENGALCHYEPSKNNPVPITGNSLLLLDSGGQYLDGTTDITRTFSIGNPSEQMKKDYTLVLKGHIALSMAEFPKGTRGYQLDTLARQPLWKEGLDYGHGTGHGVGSYLNVHEGPQSISNKAIDVAIQPGMVISNEPGIYREGKWGIRIENLILAREAEDSTFLNFETLSLFPYERELILLDFLTEKEKNWINEYHDNVYNKLSPCCNSQEKNWLKKRCRPLV